MRKLISGLIVAAVLPTTLWAKDIKIDSYTFGGLKARSIGPAVMSGRISALDATAGDVPIIYVGTASGGLWKSKDGGIGFDPIFDEHNQSIGAVKVDPNQQENIWVGTGESWVRNTVSVGDGVYFSDDSGEKWKHLGLAKTERIAAIEVSTQSSDTVFVCATGALWSDAKERGVYRTTDQGLNWEKVLYVNESTGCSDLVMDPHNPNIIYAGMWQFRRHPDYFTSGGEGSGLYRSVDGGDSWQELSNGLPKGEKGRIALAIAKSQSTTVYATVESASTALYRSDDMGKSWQKKSDAGMVQMRPFYFGELQVDPTDPERVYKPSFITVTSTDGGETFSSMFGGGFNFPVHPDHHALWINDKNPNQLVLGTDGGVYISYNKGGNWRMVGTLPVSQFYHVSHDDQWPYHVYGGLQDNGSWEGPSRAPGGIKPGDWNSIGMGDGFWAFVDKQDPNIIYSEYQGGKLLRLNRHIGEVKNIPPVAGDGEEMLRFNWNTPLLVSEVNPGTLYYGSQYLHRSMDQGESWTTISPDLTTDDPKRQRQASTGGLTIDNSTAENNATIYTIAESLVDDQLLWVGSDDGIIHVSKNAGESWQNVGKNIKGIPKGTWVSRVSASPHQAGTAFVTFDGHRTGDMQTYAYRTDDYGQSWSALAADDLGYAWVLKQDRVNPELLFLGTEFGLYISLDAGSTWARFKENLPKVAVHDLVIHPTEHDVILATHGRGVYIIDDISPLRALTQEMLSENVVMLPSRPSVMVEGGALQSFSGGNDFIGENPSEVAVITYYLKKRHMFGDMKINVLDDQDQIITSLVAGKRRGINRVDWPMRLKAPKFPPSTSLVPGFQGPRVAEGTYKVELIKGKKKYYSTVELVPDPRSSHSKADRMAQQALSMKLYDAINDLTFQLAQLKDVVTQLNEKEGLKSSQQAKVEKFEKAYNQLNARFTATKKGMITGESKLREQLGTLFGDVVGFNGKPSQTQYQQADTLVAEVGVALKAGQDLLDQQLPALSKSLGDDQPIKLLDRATWDEKNGLGLATQKVNKAWFVNGGHVYH
ncbi:VPS10 domain-containing protein [Marinicella litoralis]|uniref:Sortilin (Neurotensin receptor 3) n=1 Tax=Marinicella litoralis TaxID=644220 RepID=A0A4V3DIX2_9GAMM|nr:sialidase family protein [Marinicella litoralis]TDR23851.1 sortilin (neurotensin receptor 3) [Marinicella litoralis]